MEISINTSSWKSAHLKFEFDLMELEPVKIEIKKTGSVSFSGGKFVLKKTTKAKVPYLPVILTSKEGASRRMVIAGSQATKLTEAVKFAKNLNSLLSYAKMENSKFVEIEAFGI